MFWHPCWHLWFPVHSSTSVTQQAFYKYFYIIARHNRHCYKAFFPQDSNHPKIYQVLILDLCKTTLYIQIVFFFHLLFLQVSVPYYIVGFWIFSYNQDQDAETLIGKSKIVDRRCSTMQMKPHETSVYWMEKHVRIHFGENLICIFIRWISQ